MCGNIKIMTDFEPPSDRVYDPDLGEERDAFPDEVVNPEEEKAMQRLMRQGEEEFKKLYDEVAQSGQMSEDELNAILKAGKIKAERERQRYLEAIRSNPANIIADIFKKFDPQSDPRIQTTIVGLNQQVTSVTNNVNTAKSTDKIAGRDIQPTANYIPLAISELRSLIATYETNLDNPKVLQILNELGVLPTPEPISINQLFDIVRQANNKEESGKPYMSAENAIRGFPSKQPGLEGITVGVERNINLGSSSKEYIDIFGDTQTWARIIDKGNFTPYKPYE